MDLNELRNQITSQAESVKSQRDEAAALKKELAEKIKKNIVEILNPWIDDERKLCDTLYHKAGETPSIEEVRETLYGNSKVTVQLRYSAWGVRMLYYNSSHTCDFGSVRSFYDDDFVATGDLFINEENTMQLINGRLTDAFIKVLGYWEVFLKEKSSSLSDTIAAYRDMLSKAHTVEQNEDGTVEIQLGGKTYIGHVKEA